nr:unnamed protein product [Spirometra erinaceieuropaei]
MQAAETHPELNSSNYRNLDFKITWTTDEGPPITLWLVASSLQEKEAWCSDISQCIEQLHYSDVFSTTYSEVSSISMPFSVRADPKLFRDDANIKYQATVNSCKMPQVRHGTLGRLLDRLLDPRFQSIDFLNTFLLTYRVFTTGATVIAALRCVLRNPNLRLSGMKIDSDLMQALLEETGYISTMSACATFLLLFLLPLLPLLLLLFLFLLPSTSSSPPPPPPLPPPPAPPLLLFLLSSSFFSSSSSSLSSSSSTSSFLSVSE